MAKIAEEYKSAIDNYAKEIKTITDDVVVTRMRPGMYCGGVGNQGFLSLIREVYQNALDQIEDPASPANHIKCFYDERTNLFKCSDNGLGFPFEAMVRMATAQHTSRNFVRRPGEFPAGMHGVGLKVTNFLSTQCTIESYKYDGSAMRIDLKEGYLEKGPYKIPNPEKIQGSVVSFIPSTEVLGNLNLEWKKVYKLIKNLLAQAPLGAEVEFQAIDSNGEQHNESFINKDGIITILADKVKMSITSKPIAISYGNNDYRLRVAFAYDAGGEQGPDPEIDMIAFCNMCPTIAGPHIDATIDAISRWFMTYMNGIYLVNQKAKQKTKVTAADIKTGLTIMISAASGSPVFIGQAKEKLGDDQGMTDFCKNAVNAGLDEWSKANSADLLKLAKYYKDIADIRMKSEGEKVKMVTRYQQNTLTGLPAKYARPTVVDKELLIVEGDSAGGSAKSGRDVTCQGIFPIRGKIISAFSNSKQKFWNNEEAQGIAKIILNKDYYRNFDPIKDVKWEKIIFMADADVDGAHIASLLLRFFLLYMPQLIEAGKVYKALPPLYSFENGKTTTYITDQIDFINYVKKCFIKSNTIQNLKGEQLSDKQLTLLFATNEDYVYEIERLANTYAVDVKLMEMAIYERYSKLSFSKIQKELKSAYRFMEVTNTKSGDLLYRGTIKESNYLFMNDRLAADCQRVLSIIDKNSDIYFIMNGKKSTLYDIMKAFEKGTPSSIKRYKGLGEMDANQLAISTLRPTAPRVLIRYTLEDAKEEIACVREYESDRSKLLDHAGIIKRIDLME